MYRQNWQVTSYEHQTITDSVLSVDSLQPECIST